MRDTSVRRRQKRPRIYRGVGSAVKAQPKPIPSLIVADDDPEGVVCQECGVRVKALKYGKPRAHAAGGLSTNTRAGRYKCEGSGNASE